MWTVETDAERELPRQRSDATLRHVHAGSIIVNGRSPNDSGTHARLRHPLSLVSLISPASFLSANPPEHKPKMKFLSILSVALLSASASARSLSFVGSEQHALEEEFPVPGDNPLLFCAKPTDNILELEKVDLSPNPPAA